jgi:hypothetical protein
MGSSCFQRDFKMLFVTGYTIVSKGFHVKDADGEAGWSRSGAPALQSLYLPVR